MKLNKKGLDLITSFEGFSHKPYLCPAGVPTIGYGTTVYPSGKRVTLRDPAITRQQGLEYKMSDIRKIEGDLILALDVKLSENRYSALVSFVYNLGITAFRRSTLRKTINAAPGAPGIRDEFMKWNKAGGKVLNGLVARRKAEADLYFDAN